MAEDVIDIRKRIEEIRNEVSSAMESSEETVIQSRPAGELAEFSVPGVTSATAATAKKAEPAPADPVVLTEAKSALDDALKLPSFQLNVRNQGVNKLLMFLAASQLVTNVGLIAILWYKLG